MKASSVVAPKALPKEAPDLEEAIEDIGDSCSQESTTFEPNMNQEGFFLFLIL